MDTLTTLDTTSNDIAIEETTSPANDDTAPTKIGKHGILYGELSPEFLARPLTVAFGQNRQDKNFRNVPGTVGSLVEFATTFDFGEKDGLCLLQGEIVGTQRIAKNMARNYLLIVDIENGSTFAEVGSVIVKRELFAILNTTHSHGKAVTVVNEDHFQRWLKKANRNLPTGDDAAMLSALVSYLRDEKRYREGLLVTCSYAGRQHVDGGVKYIVKHAPMDRMRLTMLLKEPFEFAAGTSQRARIDEWKTNYVRVCDWVGVGYDSACVDPSRLFYTPRIPRGSEIGEGKHEIVVFAGATLDVDALPASNSNAVLAGLRTHLGGDSQTEQQNHTFKTKGLLSFARRCPDFDILGFLEAVAPDDRRSQGDGDKADWCCPNEDGHTKASPDDRAFFASFNGEYWHAECLHDGCKNASQGDRLWYLDMLCQKYGIEDASELEQWSETAGQQRKVETESKGKIETAIEALTVGADVRALIKMIAETYGTDDDVLVAGYFARIKAKTDIPVPSLWKPLNKIRARDRAEIAEAEIGEVDAGGTGGVRKLVKRLVQANKKKHVLYRNGDGVMVRAIERDRDIKLKEMNKDAWLAECVDLIGYEDVGRGELQYLAGTRNFDVPTVERIVNVPVFANDGTLVTTRGYHEGLRAILSPNLRNEMGEIVDFLPVPDVITAADVKAACDLIEEVSCDVAFSDVFDGNDASPVKLAVEPDQNGYVASNPNRGRSSRANFAALLLQPIVRNMIEGPCPAYYIGKPAPGHGADLLRSIASYIINGEAPVAKPFTKGEETRKTITSALRQGDTFLAFNNVAVKVEGDAVAGVLTTGTWQDRELGSSNDLKLPVRCVWIFDGNNVRFSDELAQRILPIYINTKLASPRNRGDDPKLRARSFKHSPLDTWIKANRGRLVQALHIIVKWWVQEGKKPGSLAMGSFEHYSMTMSGIFETCGRFTEFGANRANFRAQYLAEDGGGTGDLMTALWVQFGKQNKKFGLEAALSCVVSKTGEVRFGVPVDAAASHGSQITAFGKYMQGLRAQTFDVPDNPSDDKSVVKTVTLVRKTIKGKNWWFVVETDKEVDDEAAVGQVSPFAA